MKKTRTVDGVTLYGELADVAAGISPEEWDYYRLADTISDLIAQYMDKHGVTKAELADRMGTSRAFVSKVLVGDANMTLKTLSRLLHHLEAKPEVKIVAKAGTIQWMGMVKGSRQRVKTTEWKPGSADVATTLHVTLENECERIAAA